MALRIAFYSGMRLSEIRRAVPRGTAWVLDDTKNGNPRIVPIHPKAAVCARRFNPKTPKITISGTGKRHARRLACMACTSTTGATALPAS